MQMQQQRRRRKKERKKERKKRSNNLQGLPLTLEEYTKPSASPDRVQTTVVNSPSSRSVRRQAAYDNPSSCTVGSMRQIPPHRTFPPPRSPHPAEMVPIRSATALNAAPYPSSSASAPAANSRTTSNGVFPSASPASVNAARSVRSVPASTSSAVSLGRILTVPASRLAVPATSTMSVPSKRATRRSRGILAASSAATSAPASTIRSQPVSRKTDASRPDDAVMSAEDRTISMSMIDGSRPSVSVRYVRARATPCFMYFFLSFLLASLASASAPSTSTEACSMALATMA